MLYEFQTYQMEVEDHIFWVAESKELKGCVGQGDTAIEAIKELEINEKEWIVTAKEFGIPVPPQCTKVTKSYSGKIALRVSPIVHEDASNTAASLGISLNQFINDAIISYTGKVNESTRKPLNQSYGDSFSKVVNFPDTRKPSYCVVDELEEM